MADAITFEIEGVNSLNAKLDTVSNDIRFKGGRFALRKAANLVRDKAKENAARLDDPETGRKIADNVAVRWSSRYFKRTGNLKFRVGVLGGGKLEPGNPDTGPGGATPHWHLLELGTSKMPAQPFMRTALSSSIEAATAEFVTQYGKAVDRAIKRAAKKASS
ncbi:HK97-gp10 family putative phage morphogenesis protein [Salinicola rhizosphaerae]|uniref:HK97 gp10 family phage protein n=1 Tax=Salinicola rhizosphaerae TaxID=1443141 RepID=A0ABQ3E947_9GAMM|nr:HK97-gp10 family putative phage morphogenesis protein [Salinicola rhizosphaerae]GHB30477.1 hypothetical protein GCM10009038_31580 [Salinicola rhizosphaerae]